MLQHLKTNESSFVYQRLRIYYIWLGLSLSPFIVEFICVICVNPLFLQKYSPTLSYKIAQGLEKSSAYALL